MPVVSEMRNMQDYTLSVLACQSFVTVVYCVVGGVIYHYTGQ